MSLPRPVAVLLVVLLGGSCTDDPAIPRISTPRTLRGMIVFASDRGAGFALHAMRPDGTGLSELDTPGVMQADDPAVAPDGRRVAFTGISEAGKPNVHVMDLGNGPADLLTPEAPDQRPTWSPDGSRLAFEAFTGGSFDIVVADPDRPRIERLVDGPADEGAPSWSPDGRSIAFVSDEDGDADLYVAGVGSGRIHRVTDHPGDDLFPSWSPDGSELVYERDGDIAIIDAAGGEPRVLAPHPARDTDPVWSPDGSRIAFESTREGGERSDIFVMFADGTGILRLTHDDADDEDPAWR